MDKYLDCVVVVVELAIWHFETFFESLVRDSRELYWLFGHLGGKLALELTSFNPKNVVHLGVQIVLIKCIIDLVDKIIFLSLNV